MSWTVALIDESTSWQSHPELGETASWWRFSQSETLPADYTDLLHHDTRCTFKRNPKKLAECVKSINIGCNDLNIPSVGIKEATTVRVAKNKTAGGTFYHFGRNHKQLSGIKRGGASQEFRKPDTRISFTSGCSHMATASMCHKIQSFTRRELREEEIPHTWRKPSSQRH